MRSFTSFENPKLGTEFELNDHRGVIVGIATVADRRAVRHPDPLHYLQPRDSRTYPPLRYTTSYILVEPKAASDIAYYQASRLRSSATSR
jgi:putative ABC transport system permease protein